MQTPTLVSWLNLLFWSILLLLSRCTAASSGGNPPTPGQVRASIHWGVAEHTFPCIPSLWHYQSCYDTVNIQLPKHWMGKSESLLGCTSQELKPQPLVHSRCEGGVLRLRHTFIGHLFISASWMGAHFQPLPCSPCTPLCQLTPPHTHPVGWFVLFSEVSAGLGGS